MKKNKLAAGALALALGFGAVAPSLAKEDTKAVETKLSKKELREKLEESITRAETVLEAVKLLERMASDVIAPHKAELDKLVAEQKVNLERAEKALEYLQAN